MKTGPQHLESLRDGREVYLNGAKVADVTEHPAFRKSVRSMCRLYDAQCDPALRHLLTYVPDDSKERASRIWQLPASFDELVARREALEHLAEMHVGYLGRSPDHVASCISGMYMGLEVFQAHDPARAKALADYYRYARDNDLFLTYVIINPQADRSKGAHEQADPFLVAGVTGKDSRGIIVRGGKMLGTSSIMANEVFVTCIAPLKPDEAAYALSFVVPMNAPGLKVLSRRSYEEAAPSVFDYPLSSRFDENDAVIYFDDVHVPWERVFVCESPEMCRKQFHATPAHVYQNYQAQVRLTVKLRFLMGVARRIAETNGIIGMPPVQQTLGELAAQAAMIEGLVSAMEVRGSHRGRYFLPDPHLLYAAQVLSQDMYPAFVTAIRELAGGGLIMLPSAAEDFAHPELARLIGKTQKSPVADSKQRVKLFKLAWDALGSEFASRHLQYEMFYAGAAFVTRGHSFCNYDWDRASALVDHMLAGYDLEGEVEPSP
ncbi:MAG: 4-hydroxyphenylacetate 3-hydroxylase N-terminal domain-containing protein [Planctomycetales bacterium]